MKHYIGICLVLLTIAGIALLAVHSCTAAIDHSVDDVRDAFMKVFQIQPQVTMNEKVVMTQTSPVAELAVVSKDEEVSLDFEEHKEVMSYQVPLTSKKLTGDATYRIKAGFDLREPFRIAVDPATHRITAVMPHAKILSVEQIGDMSLHGENAWLNAVSDDERAKMVNALNALAHQSADNSSLQSEAEKEVTQRLQDLLDHNGQKVEIQWNDSAPVPKS